MHTYNSRCGTATHVWCRYPRTSSFWKALRPPGLVLPFGCRYGACLTCAPSLIEGAVDQSGGRALALRTHHVEDGYVLLCVARPRADCVIDVGTRKGLYIDPFKRAPHATPAI